MISETDSQSYVSSSSRFRIESSPLDNSFVSDRLITRLDLLFSFISTYAISIKSYRSDPLRIENSADYFRLFPPRDGHEEIKDVAHKGDFDPARLFRRRKSSIYVAVLPRRYLGHFPIMRLEACERGMRNNVSAQRLTAGLKRMLRNQKTTSSLLQRRMNGAGSKSSFFFSFSPFLSLVSQPSPTQFAAPNSFHSLFLLRGKNESYTKLMIPLRKLYYSDINWIDDGSF